MATYIQKYNNARNVTFKARVGMALLQRALTALNETPPIATRVTTAKRIITEPNTFVDRACDILASQDLDMNSTDAQIDAAINAMTDTIASTFS